MVNLKHKTMEIPVNKMDMFLSEHKPFSYEHAVISFK